MPISGKQTQEFVPIKEIKDGVVVLKDNSIKAVLLTSSLNFSLKSSEMQEAIIMQFQNFLNSLDFSVQIFIQSRRLNMGPYIQSLEERYEKQESDLMKIQVREYIKFIEEFGATQNIMTKNFFVVVSFAQGAINTKKGIGGIVDIFPKKEKQEKTQAELDFEEMKMQLEQRVAVVEQGLTRCGIRTVRLGTEELVELYYQLFNPDIAEKPLRIEE
jgi:type IV secretory pathway VirB4 component